MSVGSLDDQQGGDAQPVPLLSRRGLVFVGHSSRMRSGSEIAPPDTLADHRARKNFLRKLIDHLQSELNDRGFDVWVDQQDLPAGSDIDGVIYEALGCCRVALILIDRDALTAEYLRNECNILMFQRSHRDVIVLPVFLHDVSDHDLSSAPLGKQTGLAKLRPIRPRPVLLDHSTAESVAVEISNEVESSVPRVDAESDNVVARWLTQMVHDLDDVDEWTIRSVSDHLGLGVDALRRSYDPKRTLASALLACSDVKVLYRVARELVASMPSQDTARRAVERITPLWVDPSASRIVLEAHDLSPDDRLLGLSTRNYSLGRHVVQRSTLSSPDYEVISLPDILGEDPLSEWVSRSARTIRGALNLTEEDDDDEVRADINDFYRGVWTLMRLDVLDSQTAQYAVDEIQRRFGPVSCILLGYRQVDNWVRPRVTDAYQELDSPTEREIERFVHRARSLIFSRSKEYDIEV